MTAAPPQDACTCGAEIGRLVADVLRQVQRVVLEQRRQIEDLTRRIDRIDRDGGTA